MTTEYAASSETKSVNANDQRVMRFTEAVIRFRWLIVALAFVLALGTGYGGQFLGFSTNYRVFFSDDNPQLQQFEALQNTYIREDNITFVFRPDKGTVFRADLLEALQEVTDEAWKIPFTTRVDSLTNFQNSYAYGEDDLIVEDLVPKGTPLDSADLERIEKTALGEPLLLDRLISPDGRTISINVTVTLPLESETETPTAMAAARALAEQFRAENPDVELALTGSVALNNAFSESAENDIKTLVPLMYGILLLVMVVLLRSFAGTVATLLVIAFSAMTAMGLAGWLGINLTPPSAIAPTIILTLAIADSIHILITMLGSMRKGMPKHEAIIESLRVNFAPVFLTSITTAIGFLSLNFSDAPPFRDLGNISAMGVMAAWLYSILLLPAMMAILPIRVKVRDAAQSSVMERFAGFVVTNRLAVFLASAAVVVVLAAMVPRIELNDQFVKYFDETIEFRRDTDFAMEHLSGIYQAQWSLPAGESSGISNPDYLKATEDFSNWLRARPEVVHVLTITDIFNRLNKNMHADDPSYYRLPDEKDLSAQYLLLFEMSLPYGLDLNNQINVDKSSTRMIATLENIATSELRALDQEAKEWLQANMPKAQAVDASGPFVMFAYISQRNIEGMLVGTFAAFLLISLCLTAALRSIKLGLISLVPNLVPPIMGFGVWALLVGEIGLASSVVTATALGIIVDATVHFLSKYKRARVVRSENPEQAVRYAFSTVGTALWVTSAILVAGFAVLSLSAFEINSALGQLTAITLVMALIADFLLLPALLLFLDKDKEPQTVPGAAKPQPAE